MSEADSNIRAAREWSALAGRSCLSAVGNILDSQRREDGGGFSRDSAKQALKEIDEAKAHLMRALVHYEMAEETADG